MDFMNQINEMTNKGNALLDEVKDYEEAIVLGGIATILDEYCKRKGLNVRDTWERLNEIANEVHTMFND